MPTRKLYIGSVSVWLIGPPRVSTYTTVRSPNVKMNENSSELSMIGRISGSLTWNRARK